MPNVAKSVANVYPTRAASKWASRRDPRTMSTPRIAVKRVPHAAATIRSTPNRPKPGRLMGQRYQIRAGSLPALEGRTESGFERKDDRHEVPAVAPLVEQPRRDRADEHQSPSAGDGLVERERRRRDFRLVGIEPGTIVLHGDLELRLRAFDAHHDLVPGAVGPRVADDVGDKLVEAELGVCGASLGKPVRQAPQPGGRAARSRAV